MDERLRLLKRIRTVCRIAQWLLLLIVVLWVGVYLFRRGAVAAYRFQTFDTAQSALYHATWNYWDELRDKLVLFPPPSDPARREAWADSLTRFVGTKAGIFIAEPHHVTWVRQPADFAADAARLEAKLDSTKKAVWYSGFTPVRLYVTSPEEWELDSAAMALVAGDTTGVRGGILFRRRDLWQPIAARLTAFSQAVPGGEEDPLAARLADNLEVRPHTVASPFRVRQFGKILYASPDLDTAMTHENYPILGADVDIYLSYTGEAILRFLGSKLSWPGGLIYVLFFACFELIYRWAGRLRERVPVTEPANIAA